MQCVSSIAKKRTEDKKAHTNNLMTPLDKSGVKFALLQNPAKLKLVKVLLSSFERQFIIYFSLNNAVKCYKQISRTFYILITPRIFFYGTRFADI